MAPPRALLGLAWSVLLACGTNVDLGGKALTDAHDDTDGPSPDCPGFAAPNTPAKCQARMGHLQPNGCFGGYYCRRSNTDCQPQSVACGAGDAGGGG